LHAILHLVVTKRYKMKQANHQDTMFSLLRFALGIDSEVTTLPAEWETFYEKVRQQSLSGILFDGVNRLAEGQAPPFGLALRWAREAERLSGLNALFNAESARLTRLFEAEGHQTFILKGQANARLYPNPLRRHAGDIDIWVSGGRQSVAELLVRAGMLNKDDVGDTEEYEHAYHFHLPPNEHGITVEVHYSYALGGPAPRTYRRLMAYLDEQAAKGVSRVPEGFNVPSLAFALPMQLSHISKHILIDGLSLRQVIDYYMLLKVSSESERQALGSRLHSLGLYHVAAGLMWVLAQMLHIPENLMLTAPDRRRGRWILNHIVDGGNFAQYNEKRQQGWWERIVDSRWQRLQRIWLSPADAKWFVHEELEQWRKTVKLKIEN